jgi:V8-like Glu-specific endopeptidase
MSDLDPADRLRVVRWLSELPEFAVESSRRQLLSLAGLGRVSPQVDLSGSPLIAGSTLVDFLLKFGRPTADAEALGLLLNVVATLVGVKRQAEISALLEKYQMMRPIAPSPPSGAPRSAGFPSAELNEKIIGQNTLRPIAFLALGLQAAHGVAFIQVGSGMHGWTGTGFLVAPDLLLTNHHVIGSVQEATEANATFGYELDEHGRMALAQRVPVTELLATDAEADCTLVRLESRARDEQHCLTLSDNPIGVGDRVNIIQHPAGQPKQVALQNNLVEYVDEVVVQYLTSTLPGSSGSPVLNDDWEVVAIHHSGGMLTEPATNASYYRNEGICVRALRAALPADILPKPSEGDS